jgi:hypothetical protein
MTLCMGACNGLPQHQLSLWMAGTSSSTSSACTYVPSTFSKRAVVSRIPSCRLLRFFYYHRNYKSQSPADTLLSDWNKGDLRRGKQLCRRLRLCWLRADRFIRLSLPWVLCRLGTGWEEAQIEKAANGRYKDQTNKSQMASMGTTYFPCSVLQALLPVCRFGWNRNFTHKRRKTHNTNLQPYIQSSESINLGQHSPYSCTSNITRTGIGETSVITEHCIAIDQGCPRWGLSVRPLSDSVAGVLKISRAAEIQLLSLANWGAPGFTDTEKTQRRTHAPQRIPFSLVCGCRCLGSRQRKYHCSCAFSSIPAPEHLYAGRSGNL